MPETPEPEASGPAVRWVGDPEAPVLVLPAERFDAGLLRDLRRGSVSGLPSAERPDGRTLEAWVEGGAAFVSEVPLFSRLFLDNRPLYKGAFLEAASVGETLSSLVCQLPRVAPVLAVLVPGEAGGKRRILVCSDRSATPAQVLQWAP